MVADIVIFFDSAILNGYYFNAFVLLCNSFRLLLASDIVKLQLHQQHPLLVCRVTYLTSILGEKAGISWSNEVPYQPISLVP